VYERGARHAALQDHLTEKQISVVAAYVTSKIAK